MSKKKERYMSLSFGKEAWVVLVVLAGLLILTSCSSVSPPPPAELSSASAHQPGVPGRVIVNTIKVSARVSAIDKANRKATLLGSDGKTFTVTVGPEAENFDQVEVGDLVNLTVTEELVIYLDEEGASSTDGSAALVALAPKGAQPGGLVAGTTQVTGIVSAIDRTKRTATLQFGDGSTKTFPVRDDVDLSQRKVGEQVVFRVTEMIAISVEKQ
jgi:hypothetical protein